MVESYRIAAYTRISVDTELDKDNTSIENQKSIIAEYCRLHFPTSTVDYYEDRDRSGYTFEQRPGYMSLRPKLMTHGYDILIIKDLSRFSRRTGRGLVEFEDLAEKGVRIISIGDNVDSLAREDDWIKIKLYFFVNEMPVTDASSKVRAVVASRQEKGEWICAVPYGYVMTNSKKGLYEVDEAAAEVVRTVFRLYLDGWGYKKIANHLTERHIPTPRMQEKARREAAGEDYKGQAREAWSIVTVSEMLTNDFYIGTLRQRKYQRRKINGQDLPVSESDQLVFENAHTPIVDYRTFAAVQEQLKLRAGNCYRGVKKYENTYSGLLFCGDCGSPMFALSRKDLAPAYTCGTYHVRGKAGCTSHHVRCDVLDDVLKTYLRMVRDNSARMMEILEASLHNEETAVRDSAAAIRSLDKLLEDEKEQLKMLMKQKTRDLLRAGDNASVVEQTYDALIEEAGSRIQGLENQIALTADSRNTVIRVNRAAKTVLDIFDDILNKDKLDKADLSFLLDRILVYEDHIDVMLKADIDELLRTGTLAASEVPANFDSGTENTEKAAEAYASTVVQSAPKHADKVFRVRIRDHVISEGDPLEIYTDREGEVIFKKYSPIGELAAFAGQYAETLYKTCGLSVAICDRDSVIACAGVSRKEFGEKPLSGDLESIIESRGLYTWSEGTDRLVPVPDTDSHYIHCAMPIVTEGDIVGCVVSLRPREEAPADRTRAPGTDVETKLIQTAASFLGRQLEA